MARSSIRALEIACWAFGIVLVGLYFSARAHGEIERRQAISTLTQARTQVRPAMGPAALLRIARVGLEVPVYADTTERNLNRGAGLIAGTAPPDGDGNIAIAAHRDGYFRALRNVMVGDVVEIESLSRRREYRVTWLAIVKPTDLWPLYATDGPAVTLVTCYPFHFVGSAPQRYIVRAVAVE
jgi:sortase A